MKFVDIDPKEVDTSRAARRGRVAYPIVKGFMERNVKMSKLDLTDTSYNAVSLRANLSLYIQRHEMPIKIFQAGGELHMMRLDIDNDGNPIDNWETGGEAPKPLTPAAVNEKFKAEKAQAMK